MSNFQDAPNTGAATAPSTSHQEGSPPTPVPPSSSSGMATHGSDDDYDISNTRVFAVGTEMVQKRGCRVTMDKTDQGPPSSTVAAIDGGGIFRINSGDKVEISDAMVKSAAPWDFNPVSGQSELVTVTFKCPKNYSEPWRIDS